MQLGFGMNHSFRNLDRLWSLPLAKAEFKVHYAKVHARCSTGTTQTRVEYLFKGVPDRQMLINLLELVVQVVKRSIDETVTKTHLLRMSPHMLLLYTMPLFGPKKIVTFPARTLIRFSESEKRRLELFSSFLMTSNESGRLRRFAGPSSSGWII
jgi:hypothetical protein